MYTGGLSEKENQTKLLKLYSELFGYTPTPSQYNCTTSEFYTFLNISIREPKDISTHIENKS